MRGSAESRSAGTFGVPPRGPRRSVCPSLAAKETEAGADSCKVAQPFAVGLFKAQVALRPEPGARPVRGDVWRCVVNEARAEASAGAVPRV